MRVVINGLAALKPRTGVGHHVARIGAELPALAPRDQFWMYPGERLGRLVARTVGKGKGGGGGPPSRVARLKGAAKAAGKGAAQLHFSAACRAGRFDLYHEPNFVPFASPVPTVVTVHDLSVVRFPEWHPADRVAAHARHFEKALARADHVVVVSEAVRREMIDGLNVPAHRVTAVPNGVGPEFRPHAPAETAAVRAKYALPECFFLCVGTVEPRKNLLTALRAFAALPPLTRGRCPLILAGPWGWRSAAERRFFDEVAAPAGARHLGYVPSADLPALYAAARALVYPTFYEGFGLPPLEMLASGGAVLASTDPAVREVTGPLAHATDPHDADGWYEALLRAASDPDWLAESRRAGPAHARLYSWERAARETLRVYRRVLGVEVAPALLSRASVRRSPPQHIHHRHRVEQPVRHHAGRDAPRPHG